MARENQGLQIALIIFVMLTIILGVTTYLFFRQYEEATNKVTQAQADANTKSQEAAKSEEDAKELKRMIGSAQTDKVDDVTKQFNEDMKKFKGTLPDDACFYRPLIEKLGKTVEDKNTDLVKVKAEVQEWKDKYEVREASKDPQIKDLQAERDRAAKDLASRTATFKGERDRITADETKLQNDLQTARKESAASVAQIQGRNDALAVQVQKLAKLNEQKSTKLEELTSSNITVPDGEIRWVNMRNNTVWINVGRADSLSRQVTFSVYPADITDLTLGGKKASIEVTQILGDHLSEARVLDDKVNDPILQGDKIHTPVWAPGEKRHFALLGVLDIDGDGKSDLETVKNLITMNGGVIDCYMSADKGKAKRVGEMSVNTRYVVLGDAPKQPDALDLWTRMLKEADRLGIAPSNRVQLGDLLQKMGWKNQTPVVRYGQGANPKDFRAKPEEGIQKTGTGTVSDVFKPREAPPIKAPRGAY